MSFNVSSREISIPVTSVIAVQEDSLTQSLTFSIPLADSYYNLNDLTPFILYKPYGSSGVRFQLMTDKTVSGDNILVTWVVNREATFATGKLQFQIVFTDTSVTDPTEDYGTHRWATKVCSVNIPESLIGEPYAVPVEPIIVQMTELAVRAETAAASAEKTFTFKGVCTYAQLPASGNQVNDLWTVTDRDNNGYAWNGTAWYVAPSWSVISGVLTSSEVDTIWDNN